MSLSEQESRLAELKELQEQLQTKLLFQLSSSSCNEGTINEEMKLEIIQTLNEISSPSRLRDNNEHLSTSSLNNTNSESITQPYATNQQKLSPSPQNHTSLHDQTTSSYYWSEKESDISTSHINSSFNDETGIRVVPLEAWNTSITEDSNNDSNNTPVVMSTGFLSHLDHSESQLIIDPQEAVNNSDDLTDTLDKVEDTLTLNENNFKKLSMTMVSNNDDTDPASKETKESINTLQIAELHEDVEEDSTSARSTQDHHCSDTEESSYQRQSNSLSSSPIKSTCLQCDGFKVYVDQLLTENTQWKFECGRLETQLDQCMSITNSVTETNDRLMKRTANYQEECQSKEQLVSMLRSRITTLSGHVESHGNVIAELKEKNNELEEELDCAVREKKDLRELLSQTNSELDDKTSEIGHLEAKINAIKSQLYNTEDIANELHTKLSIMKDRENQFQSTIHSMEEEIKSLQLINNRLHSQSTHFQLSDYSYQDHTPFLINVCDESKMTSPHRNMEIHHEHTSLIKSPRDQRSTLDPTTATSNNKMKRPLTRKKWLESSEGGFIFGSPSEGEDFEEIKKDKENNIITSYSPRSSRNTPSSKTQQDEYTSSSLHQYSPVQNILQSIKDGKVTSNEKSTRRSSTRSQKSPTERIEQQVEARIKLIPVVEKKLEELQKEKEKLEHILQRAPPTGKVSVQSKQMMMDTELRLDEVTKEIGTARLFLLGSPSWKKK